MKADFTVAEDLAEDLRVGLFATPGRTYEAWIRYSNAAVLREDDLKAGDPAKPDERKNGSRGMAIKVLDVDGEMLSEDDGRANQDFLMINTPEFAFANVRDYLRLNRILMLSVGGSGRRRRPLSSVPAASARRQPLPAAAPSVISSRTSTTTMARAPANRSR